MKPGRKIRKSQPWKRGSGVQATFRQLRELIVRGRLAPGTRIVEADVAERLGVSRTLVRSALHRLQQEGYIVSIQSGSKYRMTVSPLTKEDARELYWIVGHVEGLAARLAAQLEIKRRKALCSQLRSLNESLRRMAETKMQNPNDIFDADLRFHKSIVEAGAGPRLLAFHNAIKPQAERYWRLYSSAILSQLTTSVAEHARIIRGIEQKDGDEAEQGVRTNWEKGAERLCAVIDRIGEHGSW